MQMFPSIQLNACSKSNDWFGVWLSLHDVIDDNNRKHFGESMDNLDSEPSTKGFKTGQTTN